MLVHRPAAATHLGEPSVTPSRRHVARPRRASTLVRALAFAGAAGLILVYALRGGGSYDVVSFEEIGLVIWWILAVGVALGLLPRRRPSGAALLLMGALGAYAAWTALSLLWTQSSELTTEEIARSLDYLGVVALGVCLLDRDSWRPAAVGLGSGALLVCVIALGSRLDPALFGRDHVASVLHSDRLSYPFGYWNAVAAWGAMCSALGLVWSAHDSSRLRRALALGLVPVAGTMTYATYSRAGVGGTALALLAALALSRNRITVMIHALIAAGGSALAILAVRGSPQIAQATGTHGAGSVVGALVFAGAVCGAVAVLTRQLKVDRWRVPTAVRRPLAAAALIVVVVGGVAAGPRLATRAWHSFKRTPTAAAAGNPTARLSSLSGTRYVVWKSAIKAFDAHPADGAGAGTFEFWWNEHGTTTEFIRDAHNIWLENLAELGVPGLLLIVAVAAAAVVVAITVRVRARRNTTAGAAAAILGVALVYLLHASVDWMWESTAVTALALAGVGVLAARLSQRRLRLRLVARVALVTVAAVAAAVQLPGILSSLDIRSSQAAERAGNGTLAMSRAKGAVAAEPWSASAHEQEALALESGGQPKRAEHQETVAISDEPLNYAHWLIRSRIETELGQFGAAVRDYNRAFQLRPRAALFWLAPYFRTR